MQNLWETEAVKNIFEEQWKILKELKIIWKNHKKILNEVKKDVRKKQKKKIYLNLNINSKKKQINF